ncbi:MAG: hypothetical protein SEPTF4163_006758, partial [Sporothrix epigloea]
MSEDKEILDRDIHAMTAEQEGMRAANDSPALFRKTSTRQPPSNHSFIRREA